MRNTRFDDNITTVDRHVSDDNDETDNTDTMALGVPQTRLMNSICSDIVHTSFISVCQETAQAFASMIVEDVINFAQRYLQSRVASQSEGYDVLPCTPHISSAGVISPLKLKRDTFHFHRSESNESGLIELLSRQQDALPPIAMGGEGSGLQKFPSDNPRSTTSEEFLQLNRKRDILPPINTNDESHDQKTAQDLINAEAKSGMRPLTPLPAITVNKQRLKPKIPSNDDMRIRPAPFQINYTRDTYKPYPNVRHLPQFMHNQQGVASARQVIGKLIKKPNEFKKLVCPKAPNFRPGQVMVNSSHVLSRYYNATDCTHFKSWTPVAGRKRQTKLPFSNLPKQSSASILDDVRVLAKSLSPPIANDIERSL